jgi:hypothetical protein
VIPTTANGFREPALACPCRRSPRGPFRDAQVHASSTSVTRRRPGAGAPPSWRCSRAPARTSASAPSPRRTRAAPGSARGGAGTSARARASPPRHPACRPRSPHRPVMPQPSPPESPGGSADATPLRGTGLSLPRFALDLGRPISGARGIRLPQSVRVRQSRRTARGASGMRTESYFAGTHLR